jgi:hypothetical protein
VQAERTCAAHAAWRKETRRGLGLHEADGLTIRTRRRRRKARLDTFYDVCGVRLDDGRDAGGSRIRIKQHSRTRGVPTQEVIWHNSTERHTARHQSHQSVSAHDRATFRRNDEADGLRIHKQHSLDQRTGHGAHVSQDRHTCSHMHRPRSYDRRKRAYGWTT